MRGFDFFRKSEGGDTNPPQGNQRDGRRNFSKWQFRQRERAVRDLRQNIQDRCDKLLPLAHLSEFGIDYSKDQFEGIIKGLKKHIKTGMQTSNDELKRLQEFDGH